MEKGVSLERARPIRTPELSELETFVLAVEEGSLARAAGRLKISGTAAAKRLRNLESLSGRQLLDRSTRGVKPTAHGRVLYRRAVRTIAEAEALGDLLAEMRPGADAATGGLRTLLRAPAPEAGGPRGAGEARDDAERLLITIFHTVSDALALATADSRVVDINQAWCQLVGRTRDEMVGATFEALGVSTEGQSLLGAVTSQLVVRGGVHFPATVDPPGRAPEDVDACVERIRIGGRDCLLVVLRGLDRAAPAAPKRRGAEHVDMLDALTGAKR